MSVEFKLRQQKKNEATNDLLRLKLDVRMGQL